MIFVVEYIETHTYMGENDTYDVNVIFKKEFEHSEDRRKYIERNEYMWEPNKEWDNKRYHTYTIFDNIALY